MPYLIEAGRLYVENFGVDELDRTMLAFGMPMGPMRLMDEIGIDICLHVAEFLCKELPYLPEMPPILPELVEQKRLGKKSSAGFYEYHHKRKPVAQQRGNLEASPLTAEDLRDRMVLPMINEAARILEEGVASAPEDVDLAMVLGTGFAPFTGGPLRYADTRGLQAIVSRMETLAESGGAHLAPCAYLVEKCKSGDNFYSEKEVQDEQ
jgi:3-hydroxyacyl-CoA dehydrogenase/enoyl-CoA hydratase/3-hydroxybutyryl-CoA epimerase